MKHLLAIALMALSTTSLAQIESPDGKTFDFLRTCELFSLDDDLQNCEEFTDVAVFVDDDVWTLCTATECLDLNMRGRLYVYGNNKADAKIQKKKMPKLPVKKTMQDRGRFSFLDAMSQFGSQGIAEANSILSRSGVRRAWGGFETTSGTSVSAQFNFVDETWKVTVSGDGFSCECSSNP